MRHTVTIAEGTYQSMGAHLLRDPGVESAGFAFGRTSKTSDELRLLIREYKPVDPNHVIHADRHSMKIESRALARAMKHADESKQCLVFVHSHPLGYATFSPDDDDNELPLFSSAYTRIGHDGPHASLIFPHGGDPFGRIWASDGHCSDVTRIRVVGGRFLFFDKSRICEGGEFFDRQIRAFGREAQALLRSLHVAVVGAGGTGSATAEQLIRLGVGRLSIYDRQPLEKSNVSRVFGSRASDAGRLKVEILAAWGNAIGVGTKVIPYSEHITCETVAKTLRDVDIVFGCTDDQWGRSILNELAIRYLIPVIDIGVKIPSKEGRILSVSGRVTVLAPGNACLFCRERISPAGIKAESDNAANPAEAAALRREGYAPELEEPDPSVIPFTAAMASLATTELLHRLTGFMGEDRRSTEVIHLFDRSETHTNAVPPSPECKCAQHRLHGIGDTPDFLGMLWSQPT